MQCLNGSVSHSRLYNIIKKTAMIQELDDYLNLIKQCFNCVC